MDWVTSKFSLNTIIKLMVMGKEECQDKPEACKIERLSR